MQPKKEKVKRLTKNGYYMRWRTKYEASEVFAWGGAIWELQKCERREQTFF